MSDGFTQMLDRAQAFYGALARDNTKVWFDARKPAWKADIEAPAKLFADIMAEEISRITGAGHTGKVYRIYRDIRFSRDKTPLKTHLDLAWSTGNPDPLAPMFYFAIRPDETLLACGSTGYAGEGLRRYRALVDRWGAPLTDLIDASGATLVDIGGDPLKRVPKPYDPEHPHGDLLRRKSLAIGAPLPPGWREARHGLVATVTAQVEALSPFRNFLMSRL